MNRTGKVLLGFVAIAEGLATILTLGSFRLAWQLEFCRWWLMRASTQRRGTNG